MVGRQTHRRDTVPMRMHWYGFSGVLRPLVRPRALRARVTRASRAREGKIFESSHDKFSDPQK